MNNLYMIALHIHAFITFMLARYTPLGWIKSFDSYACGINCLLEAELHYANEPVVEDDADASYRHNYDIQEGDIWHDDEIGMMDSAYVIYNDAPVDMRSELMDANQAMHAYECS